MSHAVLTHALHELGSHAPGRMHVNALMPCRPVRTCMRYSGMAEGSSWQICMHRDTPASSTPWCLSFSRGGASSRKDSITSGTLRTTLQHAQRLIPVQEVPLLACEVAPGWLHTSMLAACAGAQMNM